MKISAVPKSAMSYSGANRTAQVRQEFVLRSHRDTQKAMLIPDAPGTSEVTFRLLFSFAAKEKWTIGEMYLKTAYLKLKDSTVAFMCAHPHTKKPEHNL